MKCNLTTTMSQLCLVLIFSASLAFSQTTQFTYQGSLKDGVNSANGNYDFEFVLFDAVSGGAQIGATLTRSSVAVANGAFSVNLDFGSQFPGANRFLEIRVRQTGGGAYTPLAPRQQVNSAPYSVKAVSADNAVNAANATNATDAAQLGGVAAGQYVLTGDPRLSDARNPLPGSANYIQNQNTAPQASSNFNVSGNGAANIFDAATQYNLGGSRVLSTPGSLNLFAGALAGQANTVGSENVFLGAEAGQSNTTGGASVFVGSGAGKANWAGNYNAFVGTYAGRVTTTGVSNAFFGYGVAQTNTTGSYNTVIGTQADLGASGLMNATAIGARAMVGQSNSLVLGSINGVNGAGSDTRVGIGTTMPAQKLHVVGNGLFTGDLTVTGTLTAYLPGGSVNYIQNQNAAPQTNSKFYISGTGTADIFDASTQYNLGGGRVLSVAGTNNLFAGVNAGQANTTGSLNTFVGSNVGLSNTTGGGNTFFGASAGEANTTGSYNAFFGEYAGQANTGYYNAFFGTSAGQANTTGNANTVIGNGANLGANNLGNATALGAWSRVDQSNSLVLGSITGVNNAIADTSVGIGTTAPTNPFTVDGVGTVTGGVAGYGEVVARIRRRAAGHTALSIDAVSGQDSILYLAENGSAKWDLRSDSDLGSFQIRYQVGVANLTRFSINSAGNVSIDALGSAGSTSLCRNASNQISTCSSSARYKNNINSFRSGLALIRQLRPVSFNWKSGGMADVGLVAEEVIKVEPLLTTTNASGQVEGVKYDRIGVVLINAVKEQQAQIESLERQNERQEKQIEQQNKEIGSQKLRLEEQQRQIDGLEKLICKANERAEICKEQLK